MNIPIFNKTFLSTLIFSTLIVFSGSEVSFSLGKTPSITKSAVEKTTNPLWTKIAGRWNLNKKKGILVEVRGYTRNRGYSHLINYNTIITKKMFEKYTDLSFDYALLKAKKNPVSEMIVFAAKDYRNFYAIELTGTQKGITKISLIGSKTKDSTLPRHVKWNFSITEYDSAECRLAYNTKYNFRLTFKANKIKVFLNNIKIAAFIAPEPVVSGKIAFCNRNAVLALANVSLYHKKERIFHDNFTTDSVHRYGKNLKVEKRVIKK